MKLRTLTSLTWVEEKGLVAETRWWAPPSFQAFLDIRSVMSPDVNVWNLPRYVERKEVVV